MVRRITVKLSILLLTGVLFSCEEPLTQEELPDIDPKLVVISNFSANRPIIVTVAKSRQIGDIGPQEYLTNAEVDLYRANTFLERMKLVVPSDEEFPAYYQSWEHQAIAGTEYTIRVSAEGYQTVMAKSSVPASAKITRFELFKTVSQPLPGTDLIRKRLSAIIDFDDPLNAVNYYHLNITQKVNNFVLEGKDTLITKSQLRSAVFSPFENQNQVSAHLNGGLLFEDKPGERALNISFSVDIDPASQLLGKTYLELRTLSKEYYLYYTSLSRSEGSNSDPLTDPVIVFENIENGYGIFAGYNNALDSIQVVQ